MDVTMLLADAAQVADGKLYISAAGGRSPGRTRRPRRVAIKVGVDWHEFNASHHWELFSEDADGALVTFDTPEGAQTIEVARGFLGHRPAGRAGGHAGRRADRGQLRTDPTRSRRALHLALRRRRRDPAGGDGVVHARPRRSSPSSPRATRLGQTGRVTTYDRPFGRYLEDFVVGDVYRHWPGKTITEADDHLFCMITMNHHPLHTNAWFAEHETVHRRNVVVGNLVYSLVLGMSVPDVSGSAIANLEVETLRAPQPDLPRRHHLRRDPRARRDALDVQAGPRRRDRRVEGLQPGHGLEVCYFRRRVMVWRGDAAPPRRRPYGDDVWD